jgi:hypothetical protein
MNDLDQILAQAKYQTTLRQQRELARTQFQDHCMLAQNGRLFELTPEFLAGVAAQLKYSTNNQVWVIDRNQNPVLIQDGEAFVANGFMIYNAAIEAYGSAITDLQKRRTVRDVITK